jgi:hypothetical protein
LVWTIAVKTSGATGAARDTGMRSAAPLPCRTPSSGANLYGTSHRRPGVTAASAGFTPIAHAQKEVGMT